MPSIAQRHFYQRGEIKISYLEWNCPERSPGTNLEPLLLLHGLADSATVWSSLGDYLCDKYHIVAPDLRGHGESSKPDGESEDGYSSSEIIADLEALIDHLGWKKSHILGHSWGGKVAAIWATQKPERFSSLILVDPFYIGKFPSWISITFPFLYRVLPFLQGMGPFANQEAAEEVAQSLKQYRQWTPLQQQVFRASIESKADGTWGSKFTIPARNQIFTDVMQQDGLTKALPMPSLFIQPTKGLNRTQWQLKPYRRYLSDLEVKQVSGNHWAFLVNPNEFNREVAKFLDRQLRE
ncbi:MAG: alpha/beta hydrolase [Cyanobacteria bacterium P01_G01_bin.19]